MVVKAIEKQFTQWLAVPGSNVHMQKDCRSSRILRIQRENFYGTRYCRRVESVCMMSHNLGFAAQIEGSYSKRRLHLPPVIINNMYAVQVDKIRDFAV